MVLNLTCKCVYCQYCAIESLEDKSCPGCGNEENEGGAVLFDMGNAMEMYNGYSRSRNPTQAYYEAEQRYDFDEVTIENITVTQTDVDNNNIPYLMGTVTVVDEKDGKEINAEKAEPKNGEI